MDVEKLEVYKKSREAFRKVYRICQSLPRGWGWLKDQAIRAAGSVHLNIPEGWGRPSRADRNRHFGIATASANEVAAAMDLVFQADLISRQVFEEVWDDYDHITRMLGKMMVRQ